VARVTRRRDLQGRRGDGRTEVGDAAQRQPWERRAGEPSRCYAAFCYVRNLGPERTIRQGVKVYLIGDCPKNAPQRARQQRRYRTHDRPAAYLESVRGQWRRWSSRFHWFERCGAYDVYQEYLLRHAELRAESAAVEQKAAERVQQRELLTLEAVTLRTIARLLAMQILAVLKDPEQLKQLKLHRVKVVAGDTLNRTETVTPGVLDLLKLTGDGLKVGSELYRVAQLGQPDDDGKPKTAEKRVEELATIIAGQLMGMDTTAMLALREELLGLNGKAEAK